MDSDYTLKILTIGESGVGKTCILLRYTDNKFVKTHLTTIGENTVKLKIWDTAGQERFRNITTQYYKNADGILLVYDIGERTTFEKISQWINQIKTNNTNENVVVMLVGNKCDVEKREVNDEEARALAKEYGMAYYETSALTNYNLENVFSQLGEEIINIRNSHLNKFRSETFEKQAIKLEEFKQQEVKAKEKKCC